MINSSLEIADEDKAKLSGIIAYQGTTFTDLVRISGLSKSTDFIGANLSDVDFSNSDLRGFDFTGADLSRTYGVNIRFDKTTILTDAIVSQSTLAFEKSKREYFSENHEHYQLYKRLSKEYWTNGAIWIGENLRQSSKNFKATSTIAKYLYGNVKDQTYKNQILYGIKNTLPREEYKEFLVAQLGNPEITQRTRRGIIYIMGRLFSQDPIVKQMLLLHLTHENVEIRKICVPPVLARRFFLTNREAVLEAVKQEQDPIVRILYSEHFAHAAGSYAVKLLYREDRKSFHDYADTIDDRLFERLVRGAVRSEKVKRKAASIQKGGNPSQGTDVSFSEFVEGIEVFEPELHKLAYLGLPLKMSYSADGFRKELKRQQAEARKTGFDIPSSSRIISDTGSLVR